MSSEAAFAKHIVSSIRNELDLLKTHNYLQPQAYDEILRLLPTNIGSGNRDMPSMAYPPAPNSNYGAMPNASSAQSHSSMSPAPATVLPPPTYNASVHDNKLGTAEALYDYNGENPNTDLSFRRGDTIQLIELVNDDWWKGSLNGKTGIFPRSYAKKNEPIVREKANSPPPPPPARNSYGYSSVPPKQDSYNYPPPPQNSGYAPSPAMSNNSYAPSSNNNYPPPPPQQPSSYQSPPPQQQSYQPPPQQQVSAYSAPPPLQSTSSAPAAVEQPHEESKMASMGKKFAGNVANAATWGFGATLGSDVAHSIF